MNIMTIYSKEFNISQLICLAFYYGILYYLPSNGTPIGKILHLKSLRYHVCKHIFKSCGKNVNIEGHAFFASGHGLEIGDNSGLGIHCVVPGNIKIGKDVMMGPNVFIHGQNHCHDRIDIPMTKQGVYGRDKRTIIEDDVWIGQNVTFTVGRHVAKGIVIGTCTLLCKDFPEYSIVGGNPSRLIKSRIK